MVERGDVNSKTFHRSINRRRFGNEISGLVVGGRRLEEPCKVKEAVKEYFSSHFKSRGPRYVEMQLHLVMRRLDVDTGENPIKEFSEEEVKDAMWDCEGSKSPGPDGFNFEFFKNYWDIVKGAIMRMIKEFHQYGKLAHGSKSSFIMLIPKKEGIAILITSNRFP